MTVTDRDGVLWAYQGGSSLVSYDPSSGEMDVHSVTAPPYVYETRLAYDGPTHSIFFGGFADDEVYRYDIATGATDTSITLHPEGYLNDIFCGDRNGHIYAAGGREGPHLAVRHRHRCLLFRDHALSDRPWKQRLLLGLHGRLVVHGTIGGHHAVQATAVLRSRWRMVA